jgi:hypothetical protein
VSTTIVHNVRCPGCGAALELLMPESANVQRAVEWRQKVLDGTFNRFDCRECGENFVVERDCLYTDLLNGVMIGVYPRTRSGERAALEQQMRDTWARVIDTEAPAVVRRSFGAEKRLRVVFGYAALREKVLCFSRGLDDRAVEAVKLALLEGIPGREKAGVERLVLVDVADDGALRFGIIKAGGVSDGRELSVAGAMYADMAATRETLEVLLPGLFAGPHVDCARAREGLGRSPTRLEAGGGYD